MKKLVVFLLRNPEDKVYVGVIGIGLDEPMSRNRLRHAEATGKLLRKSIEKYGKAAHKLEILEEVSENEKTLKDERMNLKNKWIKHYKSNENGNLNSDKLKDENATYVYQVDECFREYYVERDGKWIKKIKKYSKFGNYNGSNLQILDRMENYDSYCKEITYKREIRKRQEKEPDLYAPIEFPIND